jgi:PAS domain S-box-containing protein
MIRAFLSSVLGKMMLRSLIVLSLSIVLIETTAHSQSSRRILELTRQSQNQITAVHAERFDQRIQQLKRDLEFSASLPSMQPFFLNLQYGLHREAYQHLALAASFLADLADKNPEYRRIVLMNQRGEILVRIEEGQVHQLSLEELTVLPVPVGTSVTSQELALSSRETYGSLICRLPVWVRQKPLGALEFHFALDFFRDRLQREVLHTSGHFLALRGDSQVLYAPGLNQEVALSQFWPELEEALPELWRGQTREVRRKGAPFVVTGSPTALADWLILAVVPRAEILSGLDQTRTLMVWLILVNIAVEILFLFAFTRRIVSLPITRLLKATKAFAGGDFRQRVQLKTGDEFGQLGQAFDSMAQSMAEQEDLRNRRDEEIATLNRSLSEKVQLLERTAEQREKAEQRIRESESRLKAVLDNSNSLISIKATDGRYLLANSCLARLHGKSSEEMVQLRDEQLYPAETAAELRAYDVRVMASGKLLERTERLPGGPQSRTYLSTRFPMRDSLENTTGVCCLSTDITERMVLEDQLRHAHKMEAVGKLAGGIAHDFNNILAGIAGYAELIQGDASREPLPYVERILTACHHAANLTNQLTLFSRKSTVQFEMVDLHAILGEVVSLLRRTIDPKIELLEELAAERCTVLGEPSQLHSALLNIAINARDALPKGGRISFTTRRTRLTEEQAARLPIACSGGEYLAVAIADDGVGMAEGTLQRIFEPFFTTKEVGKGTGLGLAAVYGTIASHQGSLEVHSKPGEGTTFQLYLPLTTREQELGSRSANQVQVAGSGRILLVEDDGLVREMAEAMLSRLGYEVTSAHDGAAGLERFLCEPFDLVVLDLIMPRMNGEQLLLELRKRSAEQPVLITSGYSESLSPEMVRGPQVWFLKKPYDMASLSRKVKCAIKGEPG